MSEIEELSSVGREIFFKTLVDSGVPVYLKDLPSGGERSGSFEKKSAFQLLSSEMEIKSGKIFFRRFPPLEKSARAKRFVMFFYLNGKGCFCAVDLKAVQNFAECAVPEKISRIESSAEKKLVSVSGSVSYKAGNSQVVMKIFVPESYDVLEPAERNMKKYLETDFEPSGEGLRPPLDILHISGTKLVFGDRTSSYPFSKGGICSVSLDFELSPVIRRSVNVTCSVAGCVEREGKRCCVLSLKDCRLEDKRFLSEGIAKFIK
ncbi:MAG: hypothetical protein IIU46_01555 [Treponema sp.]|nr:hypothetical protein [Treponema sp.]